jgi:C1A family cysteine protease
MGWLADYPDFRDYHVETDTLRNPAAGAQAGETIKSLLAKIGTAAPVASLPAAVDLRAWFSPIENQGNLGSCTANAGVGVVEYFERRAFGRHIDASRIFLYKTTRNFMHLTGDTGAYLRTTMGALALFGVPPEEYRPYNVANFDLEPPAFCYSFADNYKAIQYFRLDPAGTPTAEVLNRAKTQLAAGIPSMFGFTVYDSINQANTSGKIPFPNSGDRVLGGHAIVAVGYDDNLKIKNQPNGPETTGALRIRNSWGSGWGDAGYGYMPYDYVTRGIAQDFWCLIKASWVNTGNFQI